MFDARNTIQQFLDATAAKQPAPGGGSITALVGALAAAMGEMVLSYSLGKKSLAPFEPELQLAIAEFHRLRGVMVQLMVEDQAAYETITALRKLPEDAAERIENYDQTLTACIRIPETMAAGGVAALELCERLIDKTNVFLLSDLAVCAELAMATIRCGIYNVRVNLGGVTDAREKAAIQKRVDALLNHGVARVQQVIPRIWERIEKR